jgi:hypothetical protein
VGLKTDDIGIRQEMTLQARIFFWHGVSVVLAIVLSAAGSFILLFAMQLRTDWWRFLIPCSNPTACG